MSDDHSDEVLRRFAAGFSHQRRSTLDGPVCGRLHRPGKVLATPLGGMCAAHGLGKMK
jgi:hypothetical protein